MSSVKVPLGSIVLDLGCGTGYLATVLSEMVGPEGRVVAVDPDHERIKIAKENNGRPNIEYLVADDQSFPGDEYAVIVANHVIHWIENKETLFTRVYDKLAAKGQFAFVALSGTPELGPTMKRALRELVDPKFINFQNSHCLDTPEYQEKAESVGFKLTSAEVATTYQHWKSMDEFLSHCAGLSRGEIDLGSIDHEALENFKKHYEKELIAEKIQLNVLSMVLNK